jgi:hypothetical protein
VCTLADGTPTHGMTGPVIGTLGGAPNLRSGPPDGVCRVKLPAPVPISTVSMDYRYLTGCEYSAAQHRAPRAWSHCSVKLAALRAAADL